MKINELTIRTKNLGGQMQFYVEHLGFEMIAKTEDSFSIQVGYSELTFHQAEDFHPYHIALNIPSNQIQHAKDWLCEKTKVLKDGDLEIQTFDNWNAQAIYFYDADGNIMELIARKNLELNSNNAFSAKGVISISEIGAPLDDIKPAFDTLNEEMNLQLYDGNFERFCAAGDEEGLFIIINKQVKDWFPTNDKAFSSDFNIKLAQGENQYHWHFDSSGFKLLDKL